MAKEKEINVATRIKHVEDAKLGTLQTMAEFASACKRPWNPQSFVQQEVVIKKHEVVAYKNLDAQHLRIEDLSFLISKEEVARIFNEINNIVINPFEVASLLKDLDVELGDAMKERNIVFTENDRPEFLIVGKGNFVPGPPPENYCPKKKGGLLDAILLKHEMKNGINSGGVSPKFIGFVDSEQANPFLARGNNFTEHKQFSRMLLHGSFIHRFMLHVFLRAAEKGKLNLQTRNGKVTHAQLLEMLVLVTYPLFVDGKPDDIRANLPFYLVNLWNLIIDSVVDTTADDFHNPDKFNFSCRSPFVFNSLLLCFGKELGLPNLQDYLLDSHWKGAYEMVCRVKSSLSEDIPDSKIYTYCMEALSTTEGHPGLVGIQLPFTLDENKASLNSTYQPFDSTENSLVTIITAANVVKKNRSTSVIGEYSSWCEFFEEKKQKYSSCSESIDLNWQSDEEVHISIKHQ